MSVASGKTRIERRKRIETLPCRCKETLLIADEQVAVVGKRCERRGALPRRRSETVGRRSIACRKRRGQDGAIAGALIEVAGELIAQARDGRRGARMIGGEKAHHDARGAEAALRTVMIDHRLLHGMQSAALGKVLDRDELATVKLAQEDDTGVERLMHELVAFQPRQHDSARAAIAFGATFLRPRQHPRSSRSQSRTVARGENRSSADLAAAKSKTQRRTNFSLDNHRPSSQLLA